MKLPYRLASVIGLAVVLSSLWLGGAARTTTVARDAPAYADPAFQAARDRLDQPLDAGQVARSWYWGPAPISGGLSEAYAESPGGQRLTQYFDKGRMELNRPSGPVTSGLLTRELISGQLQTGDAAWTPREPSTLAIAGDPDNAWPTYASFAPVIDRATADQTGGHATNVLVPEGVTSYPAAADDDNAAYVQYIAYQGPLGPTGYNVPRVFWDFMQAGGLVWDAEAGAYAQADPLMDWLAVLGYPLSDPYWANVTVAGVPTWVLIQPFERRVLTYTPSNDPAWRVEMGNIGRHYLAWRYPDATPPGVTPSPSPSPSPSPAPSPTPAPQPVTPGSAFFAMQAGDIWTYQDAATGAVYTVAITGTTTDFIPGVSLTVRQETRPDGSVERTYWGEHETVLWLYGYDVTDAQGVTIERVTYTPEVRYISKALDLGAGWGTQTYPGGTADKTLVLYQLVVDWVGTLNVPSGAFEASRLTATTTPTDGKDLIGPPTTLRSFYFTPYVGIVQDTRPDGVTLQLIGADLR